jgi:hypothetical protein
LVGRQTNKQEGTSQEKSFIIFFFFFIIFSDSSFVAFATYFDSVVKDMDDLCSICSKFFIVLEFVAFVLFLKL